MTSHREWMQLALDQARLAGESGDVPVGALIVDPQDRLIAQAGNRREQDRDPTAHAEILALRQAGALRQDWQLQGCRLYVTLEPCPMCAGAIAQARIATVIYGADDLKAGALRSVLNLFNTPAIFHQPQVIGGIMEAECRQILIRWFERLRQLEG